MLIVIKAAFTVAAMGTSEFWESRLKLPGWVISILWPLIVYLCSVMYYVFDFYMTAHDDFSFSDFAAFTTALCIAAMFILKALSFIYGCFVFFVTWHFSVGYLMFTGNGSQENK